MCAPRQPTRFKERIGAASRFTATADGESKLPANQFTQSNAASLRDRLGLAAQITGNENTRAMHMYMFLQPTYMSKLFPSDLRSIPRRFHLFQSGFQS